MSRTHRCYELIHLSRTHMARGNASHPLHIHVTNAHMSWTHNCHEPQNAYKCHKLIHVTNSYMSRSLVNFTNSHVRHEFICFWESHPLADWNFKYVCVYTLKNYGKLMNSLSFEDTYEWGMSQRPLKTHMNEACHKSSWLVSPLKTHMNEACHKRLWRHIWMRHVTSHDD